MTKKPPPKQAKASSSQDSASLRRKKFVEAYLSNGNNCTQAGLAAGLSKKTAYSTGQRMLKHAEVQALIEHRHQQMLAKLQISTERTLKERARMAYYDIGDLAQLLKVVKEPADIAKLPEDIRQAITGWKWDKDGRLVIQFADKNPHLTALEKHQGLYRADNEQQTQPSDLAPKDKIEVARAIAFVLAQASKALGKAK